MRRAAAKYYRIDRSRHVGYKNYLALSCREFKPAFLLKFAADLVLSTDGHINYKHLAIQEKINHAV